MSISILKRKKKLINEVILDIYFLRQIDANAFCWISERESWKLLN